MKTSSLKKIPAAKARRAAVRVGRPPKELAGEVDARILDAARKLFLERGFEGASIDEIAEAARSGKPTIYARFRDKRALFTEVVTRDILSRITEFKAGVPNSARCRPSPRNASQRRRGSSLISSLCPCCFGRCSR
jgi:AcrR family transcriptional regulator